MQTLITHIDLDGAGSIVLSKIFNISFKNIIITDYGRMDVKQLLKLCPIIMTDLSVPENEFIQLYERGITIYDHHESSSYLKKYKGQVSDTSRCGTKIFYQEYVKKHPNYRYIPEVEMFVHIVDTYDRWQDTNLAWNDAVNLNRLFRALKLDNFVQAAVKYIKNGLQFSSKDKLLISQFEQQENMDYNSSKHTLNTFIDSEGNKYGVCKLFNNASTTCNMILKNDPLMIYVIGYYESGRISARSKPEFNLLRFNELHGHKNAAGGMLDKNNLDKLLSGVSFKYN